MNGSLKLVCKSKMEEAQEAISFPNDAINYSGLVSTALNNNLFFSKIAPTLLYGAPLWFPHPLPRAHEPLTPVTFQNM